MLLPLCADERKPCHDFRLFGSCSLPSPLESGINTRDTATTLRLVWNRVALIVRNDSRNYIDSCCFWLSITLAVYVDVNAYIYSHVFVCYFSFNKLKAKISQLYGSISMWMFKTLGCKTPPVALELQELWERREQPVLTVTCQLW